MDNARFDKRLRVRFARCRDRGVRFRTDFDRITAQGGRYVEVDRRMVWSKEARTPFVTVGVWTTDIASFKEASGGAEKPLLKTIRERCTIWGKERTRSEYTKANQ